MFEIKMIENVCVTTVITIILLMFCLWSDMKSIKMLGIIWGCLESLDFVWLTRKYIRKLEKELEQEQTGK